MVGGHHALFTAPVPYPHSNLTTHGINTEVDALKEIWEIAMIDILRGDDAAFERTNRASVLAVVGDQELLQL
ncbi:hypothetical protein GN958_ATG04577 [Phytophthora infestans]|uniref:Uncharacterized protein n=1 Tax=Phytophthora infestans TaxID=4787 RepID=A0A8S9V4Y3_PHYIN|nr:hypothetical protein GN958_ATG04577 [Phytophthora infestans]